MLLCTDTLVLARSKIQGPGGECRDRLKGGLFVYQYNLSHSKQIKGRSSSASSCPPLRRCPTAPRPYTVEIIESIAAVCFPNCYVYNSMLRFRRRGLEDLMNQPSGKLSGRHQGRVVPYAVQYVSSDRSRHTTLRMAGRRGPVQASISIIIDG